MFLNEPNVRMMLVHNRQNWVSLFLVGSVVTNVLLNLLLVPSWGALGAAVARVCSACVLFLLNLFYVTRFFVPLRILRLLLRPVLATLIMALALWPVRVWPLSVSIGVGIIVYIGTLWLVGGISLNEVAAFGQAISSQRNGNKVR